MNSKNILRLFLDVAMAVLYTILTFGFGTSLLFHELAGIAIVLFFITHVMLNWKMYKGIRRKVNHAQAPAKARAWILFLLDVLLMVGIPLSILSGVLIAREAFYLNLGLLEEALIPVHHLISYACFGVLAAHMLMHLSFLVGVARGLAKNLRSRAVMKTVGQISISALAITLAFARVYDTASASLDVMAQPVAITMPISDGKEDALYPTFAPDATATATNDTQTSEAAASLTGAAAAAVTAIPTTAPTSQPEIAAATSAPAETAQVAPAETVGEIPTLDDFLGKLVCTHCGRHCSLLSPRCGKGRSQAQQAQEEYQQTYGVTGY